MDQRKKIEINEMILKMMDGTIGEQFNQFEDWLGSEPGAVEYFADFINKYSDIRQVMSYNHIMRSVSTENFSDKEFSSMMQALGKRERLSPSCDVPENICVNPDQEPIKIAGTRTSQ